MHMKQYFISLFPVTAGFGIFHLVSRDVHPRGSFRTSWSTKFWSSDSGTCFQRNYIHNRIILCNTFKTDKYWNIIISFPNFPKLCISFRICCHTLHCHNALVNTSLQVSEVVNVQKAKDLCRMIQHIISSVKSWVSLLQWKWFPL